MPPALLLLGFGRVRRFVLPLPLILLWPLLLLGWLCLGVGWLATAGRVRPAALLAGAAGLRALHELRGTRIDVRGRDTFIYMRFI